MRFGCATVKNICHGRMANFEPDGNLLKGEVSFQDEISKFLNNLSSIEIFHDNI